jgi:hypothetical protein
MTQSNADLLNHLDEQLQFIDSSCASYDAGASHEAKRLAVHVRVLLHDTGRSKSLLTHLGLKDRTPFIEGVPEELLSVIGRGGVGNAFPGLAMMRLDGEGYAGYVPSFEGRGLGSSMLKFGRWWNDPRMLDQKGNTVSRHNVVHWLAHKDGGAHVDALEATYAALARNGSMGVTFGYGDGTSSATESPIPAAMRQIAEEVRVSVRKKIGTP